MCDLSVLGNPEGGWFPIKGWPSVPGTEEWVTMESTT
jgi:hypothetical protein